MCTSGVVLTFESGAVNGKRSLVWSVIDHIVNLNQFYENVHLAYVAHARYSGYDWQWQWQWSPVYTPGIPQWYSVFKLARLEIDVPPKYYNSW